MKIKTFYVRNFRNIKEEMFTFNDNVNIFFGKNAQGKTNLLEAISLCIGNGFRKIKPSSIIPFNYTEGNDKLLMRLSFFSDIYPEKENIIEYELRGNRAAVSYNKIPMKSAAELYGVLKYVLFVPEHLNIIKGSPDLRREYLDNVAVMQTKTHSNKLNNYYKALKQRNILLTAYVQGEQSRATIIPQLDAWNSTLAMEGINVTYGRLKYFGFLNDYSSELYKKISSEVEDLSFSYNSSVFVNTESIDFNKKDELYNAYLSKLEKSLDEDLRRGFTTVGVHRDDFSFFINGNNAKEFGSQGQLRSIALILKLSEAEILRARGETPVMLLDEIFSELDEERRAFVANNIENSQVFITSCNKNDVISTSIGQGGGIRLWEVRGGSFEEKNE